MPVPVATRAVPFFDYQAFYTRQAEMFDRAMKGVLTRGAFILQQEVRDFEAALADYLGVRHAIGVANCTDALIIGLRVAGIGPGDEVIFPSHTFVASPSSIHWVGARPIPVDMGEDGLIDPSAIEAAITPKTKAVMPVSLNGRTCKFDAIQEVCDRHGLVIVEDSAQALGSRFQGKAAGTFGAIGTFSFYPAKILGCFGDGGAIVTDDDDLAHQARLYRDHGRDEATGQVVQWGLNSRLDNLQAAVLLAQFEHYPETIARRREIASMYHEGLGGLPQLKLPPAPGADPDHFDTYQNYELCADRRTELASHLREQGIGTLIQWGGKACHQHEALGLPSSPLPRTEEFFQRCLMLPVNLFVTNDDVAYVIDHIRGFYDN
ncbi:MAG: DegT/DnrJ/EryC1/StrS family aminotransferase [Fimbriimonadaceae bacterium]|nr:DegT/DnrJ/EryC1/StrS family aminotransferase [Fimbriimonadaceae bacterium]